MTPPRLTTIAPSFLVDDVGETARWYRERLGFEIDPLPAREPWVFASLRRGGVEIMLQRLPGYVLVFGEFEEPSPPG